MAAVQMAVTSGERTCASVRSRSPVTERRSSVGARPPDPLILSCNPANNELKPGQRQPLPKEAAGVKRQALTPGPGFNKSSPNAQRGRFRRRSDRARTFGWGSTLADRSYLVGAVGTAVLTAPARNAVDKHRDLVNHR